MNLKFIYRKKYLQNLGNNAPGIRCCKTCNEGPLEPKNINPNCIPVKIPVNDPHFAELNVRCQGYIRLNPTLTDDCEIANVQVMLN